MIFNHTIWIRHDRNSMTDTLGDHPSESEVEITSNSSDLTEAVREALSRMPNDLYAAFKEAMR